MNKLNEQIKNMKIRPDKYLVNSRARVCSTGNTMT